MNNHSCFPDTMSHCRPVTRRLILLLLAGAILSLLPHDRANAQTFSKREELLSNLNDAMDALEVLYAPPKDNQQWNLPVTIPSGITLKGPNGQCITPVSMHLFYEPDIDPNNPGNQPGVRLVVTLREGNSMDIPEFSHPLVCGLNQMLWHMCDGNYRWNWVTDSEGNITVRDEWNYDANCQAQSEQKFWMIDEEVSYSGEEMHPAGGMWIPGGLYDTRLINTTAVNFEEDGTFRGEDLIEPVGSGNGNVWIARRHDADDGRIELRRAYTHVDFNYVYHEESQDETHTYIDPLDAGNAAWGYTLKLTGLKLTAQIHEYDPDDCLLDGQVSSPEPLADRAEMTMTLYYRTKNDVNCSTTWVQSWSENPADPDADNQALWDRMFGNYGRGWGEFDIDENGVLYFRMTTSLPQGTGDCLTDATEKFGLIKLRDPSVPADQCEIMLATGGDFTLDDMTGEIRYTSGSITEQLFCLDFCETLNGYLTFDNVISASAQTFADNWEYDPAAHGAWSPGQTGGSPHHLSGNVYDPYFGMPDNPFQRSERGRWRPEKGYTYRSAIKEGIGSNRVYDEAGVFTDAAGNTTDAFRLFNWRDPEDNTESWLEPVAITHYAPSGEMVEEQNILNIPGTAKLAHKETVPRLVAQNATYDAVDFQSFEESTPGGSYTEEYAHSGELSYLLNDNGEFSAPLLSVKLTDQISDRGLLIKLWVKQSYNVYDANPSFSSSPIAIDVAGQLFSTLAPSNYNTLNPGLIHKIAQTGDWSLYQLLISPCSPGVTPCGFGSAVEGDQLTITVKNNIPTQYGDHVWVDDIRAQPLDAEMTCFVYDRHTLRLIGQFDDQHFGLYSRYNGEGNLVSILRETERGVVTVSESQSWVLTRPRYTAGGGITSGPIIPMSSIGANRSSLDLPNSVHGGRGADFDIASLRIGPNGPSVDFFGGKSIPLDDLQALLDFSADFPNVSREKLAALIPDLSDVERLQLIRDLMKLDDERARLEKEMQAAVDEEKKNRVREGLRAIDDERDTILRDKLGLTAEEIEALYEELGSSSNTRVEESDD